MSIYWNNCVLRCVTLKGTEWNIDCFVGTVIMRFLSLNLTIIGLLLCKLRYYLKKKRKKEVRQILEAAIYLFLKLCCQFSLG